MKVLSEQIIEVVNSINRVIAGHITFSCQKKASWKGYERRIFCLPRGVSKIKSRRNNTFGQKEVRNRTWLRSLNT